MAVEWDMHSPFLQHQIRLLIFCNTIVCTAGEGMADV
jgi:hypothetical protein